MLFVFFFKQKTAYEMRISDWSSDVCSSDLERQRLERQQAVVLEAHLGRDPPPQAAWALQGDVEVGVGLLSADFVVGVEQGDALGHCGHGGADMAEEGAGVQIDARTAQPRAIGRAARSVRVCLYG